MNYKKQCSHFFIERILFHSEIDYFKLCGIGIKVEDTTYFKKQIRKILSTDLEYYRHTFLENEKKHCAAPPMLLPLTR